MYLYREIRMRREIDQLVPTTVQRYRASAESCGRMVEAGTATGGANPNILRRHLHPALAAVGFEKSGTRVFAVFVTRSLRTITSCPEGLLRFWLGWGSEGMSGHYDQIKNDVAFRQRLVNRCGVGFDVPVSLASIEPNEPKLEAVVEQEVAVTV